MTHLLHYLKFWKAVEHETFWSSFKEYIFHNHAIWRKLICSKSHCRLTIFCSPSDLWRYDYWNKSCVCLYSIFIHMVVILGLWYWVKTVDLVWEQCWCWSVFIHLWLNVIWYWRKLHCLHLPPDIVRIMRERKKSDWLLNVEWMWHETCAQGYRKSLIINNCNLVHVHYIHIYIYIYVWVCIYIYTKLQTR